MPPTCQNQFQGLDEDKDNILNHPRLVISDDTLEICAPNTEDLPGSHRDLVPCAVRVALRPVGDASSVLDDQSRVCNWLYNHLLEIANGLREQYIQTQNPDVGKQLYTKTGLRDLVPELKKQFPHLTRVHSSPTKNAALRLTRSIQTFQHAKKAGARRKTGWPRFRSWGSDWFSLLYDEPNKGFKIKGRLLSLSCGVDDQGKRIRVELLLDDLRGLKQAQIRSLRIVKTGGRLFAIFSVLKPVAAIRPLTHTSRVIALDPNHKNLVVGVDSQGQAIEVESPRWLKMLDRRLDELKSMRDRCQRRSLWIGKYDHEGKAVGKGRWRPSRRWQKLQSRIQRLQAKRRLQTQIFLRQLANRLYAIYDQVAIGHYTPSAVSTPSHCRRSMCAQSLIGRFKQTLAWTARKSGKHFQIYDERGTTRTCSHCGHVVSGGLAPSVRCWSCPHCQVHHNRDENAAQNGLSLLQPVEQMQGPRSPATVTSRSLWSVRTNRIVITERRSSLGCGCQLEKKAS